MPLCKICDDEVDELFAIKEGRRVIQGCEDCIDRLREEAEIAELSESVVQEMMGFRGRR